MAATVDFLQTATDASDVSTYTFSSQNLGAADSTRRIVVCIESRGTTSQTVSSVTVAGVSATEVRQQATGFNVVAIYIAEVPSGTTGDVVVTFADAMLRCAIQMYRLVDIDSTTEHQQGASTVENPTYNLNIPAGGVAVACSVTGNDTGSTSWTNLTEDADGLLEFIQYSSASDAFASEQTGLTITANPTGTSQPVGVFASWGPAGGGGGDAFNASASLTLGGVSISAAGTVVPPDFNATVDITLGSVQITAVADSEVPNYNVTADIILGGISISGVGDTEVPNYNASADIILGGVEITAVGDVENFFSASADITLGSVSVSVVGTVDNPGFEGSADIIVGGIEVSAIGDTEVPNYNATVDITLGGTEVISVGDTEVPNYTGSVDLTIGGIEVASIATFTSVSFSVSLTTLLCTARTTQQDYIDFVETFFEIIENQNLLDSETFDYLDQGTEDGILTYEDRDYWLIQIARANLTLTGRTFGSDVPTILDEADPLGLTKDANGNLRDDVLIIDPQAVNESTTAQDGPVKVISPNSCTTPGGLTKSPSLFFTGGTGVAWYYQLLSDLHSINEFGGGGGRNRFLDAATGIATKTLTCYVRYSTLHKITTQIYLGKRSSGTHALKIVIQGYPTDARVVIPTGVYTKGTPDTIPSGVANASIRIGARVGQERNHLWFRWLDFVGKVWVDDFNGNAGYVFACPIVFSNSVNTDIQFRETIVRDFLPIHPGNSEAANYPQYVDIGHGSRTFGELQEYTGLYIRSENSKVLYSYIKAAGEDIATAFSEYVGEEYADTYNLRGRGIRSDGGNNFEVGYVKAEGFTSGDYIGLVCRASQANRTGIHIYDVIINGNGYKNILLQSGAVGVESISGTVERIFSYNAGTEGFQTSGGSLAHFYAGEGTLTVKNSIFAYNLNGQIVRSGATTPGVLIDTVDNSNNGSAVGGVILDQIITWHCSVRIGKTNGWQFADTVLNTSKVIDSLLYGVPEQLKEENYSLGLNVYDAPVVMAVYGGALMGSLVVENNNIARDLTDLNATAAMVHENPDNVGTLYTVADEIIPGFENNTALTPAYISPTTGDFNLPSGNSLLSRFDSNMIFSMDDIRPWDYNPLTELCAITPTPTTEFAYRSIYAALYGHFDVSI